MKRGKGVGQTKRPILERARDFLRKVLVLVVSAILVIEMLPAFSLTANAEESTSEKAITATDVNKTLSAGDTVVFGSYPQSSDGDGGYVVEGIRWVVLNGNSSVKTPDGSSSSALFLFSVKTLDASTHLPNYSGWSGNSVYGVNNLRYWLNGYVKDDGSVVSSSCFGRNDGTTFAGTAFSAREFESILSAGFDPGWTSTAYDRVRLLTISEVGTYASVIQNQIDALKERGESVVTSFASDLTTSDADTYFGNNSKWWLTNQYNGMKYYEEDDNITGVYNQVKSQYGGAFCGVRPAIMVNLGDSLFASIKGAKAVSDTGLVDVADYDGSEWKLTILDANRSAFTAKSTKIDEGILTVSYSGAITGDDEYISVLVKDSDGTFSNYGRVKSLSGSDASGTVEIDLSGIEMDGKTVYVFNEHYNGGATDENMLTDYSSDLVEVDTTSYAVTFNFGDGQVSTSTVINGGAVDVPAAPDKLGYVVDGWYKDEGCSEKWDVENDVVTGPTELYAHWTYVGIVSVKYYDRGGLFASHEVTKGQSDTAEMLWDDAGHATFLGWSVKSDATAADEGRAVNSSTDKVVIENVSEDIDFYAVWRYTLSWTDDSGWTHATSKDTTAAEVEFEAPAKPNAAEGYAFVAWSTSSSSSSGTEYRPGDTIRADENVVLYPKWDALPIVKCYDRGSLIDNKVYLNTDGTIVAPVLSDDNATFLGWATSNKATTAEYPVAESASSVTVTGATSDTTLYAVWSWDVAFNANADSEDPKPVTATTSSSTAAIDLPENPVRTDSVFKGWATSENAGVDDVLVGPKDGSTTTVEVPVGSSLYAVWTDGYTVTFVDDANETSFDPLVFEKDQDLVAPVLTGTDEVTFVGWYDGTTDTTYKYEPTDDSSTSYAIEGISENTELHAVWSWEVTFETDADNGIKYDPVTVETSTGFAKVTLPLNNPVRDGYTFIGWATVAGEKVVANASDETADVPVGDSLVAVWSENVAATPADMTAYVGGTSLNGTQLPKLRYSVSAPSTLDTDDLTFRLVAADGTATDLTSSAAEGTDYYLFPELSDGLEEISDDDGTVVYRSTYIEITDSDPETAGLAAGTYSVSLLEGVSIVATGSDGVEHAVAIDSSASTLTVRRATDDAATTAIVTDVADAADALAAGNAVAVVSDDAVFATNADDSLGLLGDGENDAQAVLLFDDSVAGTGTQQLMDVAAAKVTGEDVSSWNTLTKYLDIVNVNDGNAVLSTDGSVTVYWPYPEGVSYEDAADYDFALVHYTNMNREGYSSLTETGVEAKAVEVEATEYGLKFETESFSPFTLMWKQKETQTSEPGKGSVPTKPASDGNAAASGAVANTGSSDATVRPTAAKDKTILGIKLPGTGDASSLIQIAGVGALGLGALATAFHVNRRRNR
jgi:uncharacterized repeat protein (TIGR02543 family)